MSSFNPELVPDLLAPGGPLQTLMGNFEDRPYQREMALEIARMLDAGGWMAIEAPTGTGKSLAYALPSAVWSGESDRLVVISTYTRALQDQLLQTEAPRLRHLLGDHLRVEVLKGRANYLCRRRYEETCRSTEEGGTRDLLNSIRDWAESTATGDLSECGVHVPRELRFLAMTVTSDPKYCSHSECSPDLGCFYKKAKNQAANAHLLVVNHALLSLHLFEGGLLPPFHGLVVDEAHAFTQCALDQLNQSLGIQVVEDCLDTLQRFRSPLCAREGEGDSRRRALAQSAEQVRRDSAALFQVPMAVSGDETRLWYRSPEELKAAWKGDAEPLAHSLGVLEADAAAFRNFVADALDFDHPERAGSLPFLEKLAEQAAGLRKTLDTVLHPDPNDRSAVHWAQRETDGSTSLWCGPLDLKLESVLEQACDRVVFTSATLAAKQDFSFFAGELGLDGRLVGMAYPSPFDYPSQVRAMGLSKGPDPRDGGWPVQSAEVLHQLMEEVGRNTLALFTSFRDIRQVEEVLKKIGRGSLYTLLAQGRGLGPAQLLERFQQTPKALLLGTSGFWQGIDLPGEALEVLVIMRLPFSPPTEPRMQARSQRLSDEGGNPFSRLQVPEAMLRFKQGFGRLVRRGSDRGVVAVLDPRLMRAGYGTRFRNILPLEMEAVESGQDLIQRASSWWKEAPGSVEEIKQ